MKYCKNDGTDLSDNNLEYQIRGKVFLPLERVKKAFYKMCATKWGVQIAGIIFRTRSKQ